MRAGARKRGRAAMRRSEGAQRAGRREGSTPILIVDDNVALGRRLQRLAEAVGCSAVTVGTIAAARAQLSSRSDWAGLVLDEGLPEGSGLTLLADVRASGALMPALIMTGQWWNETLANKAFSLGARYVNKPVRATPFERWLRAEVLRPAESARFPIASASFERRLAAMVEVWRERYVLTLAEADVLMRASRGEPRGAIAAAMDCSIETVRKHCHNLLRKTGDASLLDAALRVLRALCDPSTP